MNLYQVYRKCLESPQGRRHLRTETGRTFDLSEGWKDVPVDDGELLQAALSHLFIPGEQFWPWDNEHESMQFRQIDDPIANMRSAEGFLYAERTRLTMLRDQGLSVVGGMIVLAVDETDVADVVSGLREVYREVNELKISTT